MERLAIELGELHWVHAPAHRQAFIHTHFKRYKEALDAGIRMENVARQTKQPLSLLRALDVKIQSLIFLKRKQEAVNCFDDLEEIGNEFDSPEVSERNSQIWEMINNIQ